MNKQSVNPFFWGKIIKIWHVGILVIFLAAFSLSFSPAFKLYIDRDSGAYLYGASRILQGEILYRDIWDHKGPMIFIFNSLALLLGRNPFWSLWVLKFASLFAAALLSFWIIMKLYGKNIALYSTILWVLAGGSLNLMGNYTEEFALPFQFFCLYIYFRNDEIRPWKNYFLLGVMWIVCFLFRPNLIGVATAVIGIIFLDILRNKKGIKMFSSLSFFIGGISSITIPMVSFFYKENAISHFIDQVFTYNFIYSSASGFGNRIFALFAGFFYIPLSTALLI